MREPTFDFVLNELFLLDVFRADYDVKHEAAHIQLKRIDEIRYISQETGALLKIVGEELSPDSTES